jgi:hypothetical protein
MSIISAIASLTAMAQYGAKSAQKDLVYAMCATK